MPTFTLSLVPESCYSKHNRRIVLPSPWVLRARAKSLQSCVRYKSLLPERFTLFGLTPSALPRV